MADAMGVFDTSMSHCNFLKAHRSECTDQRDHVVVQGGKAPFLLLEDGPPLRQGLHQDLTKKVHRAMGGHANEVATVDAWHPDLGSS